MSKQDLDNANGSLEAKATAVTSAKANVRRLEQLKAFSKITAPFDGVVTARSTDVGALIDSGSNAKELFHVAAVHRLRVFVNVPEVYSRAALAGMKADLTLTEFPGRAFTGTLARTAQSIDVASRTLLTEIDVENPKGELLPGSYAEVHLKLPSAQSTYKLPVNAIIFRTEGVRVAVVGADGKVALQPVTLGRDYGNSLEVVVGRQRPRADHRQRARTRSRPASRSASPRPRASDDATVVQAFRPARHWPRSSRSPACAPKVKYVQPTVEIAPAFRENAEWKTAQPADDLLRGNWWELFGDPELNALEQQIDVSNQTLKAADGAVRAGARAGPRHPRQPVPDRRRRRRRSTRAEPSGNRPASTFHQAANDFILPVDVSYEADVWGRIHSAVTASQAAAQASAADLESRAPQPARRARRRLLHAARHRSRSPAARRPRSSRSRRRSS